MAANGIRMAAYQRWLVASTRAITANPEFQVHPSSWCGLFRSMSRSTHSPCGELLVVFDVAEIGTDEQFSHIPVPELVGFFRGGW